MDVYQGPPSYETVTDPNYHPIPVKTSTSSNIAVTEDNSHKIAVSDNISNAEGLLEASRSSAAAPDERKNETISNSSTPSSPLKSVPNSLLSKDVGPGSPLTESVCIGMLNSDSRLASGNTTLSEIAGNESVADDEVFDCSNDSVFANGERTVIGLDNSGMDEQPSTSTLDKKNGKKPSVRKQFETCKVEMIESGSNVRKSSVEENKYVDVKQKIFTKIKVPSSSDIEKKQLEETLGKNSKEQSTPTLSPSSIQYGPSVSDNLQASKIDIIDDKKYNDNKISMINKQGVNNVPEVVVLYNNNNNEKKRLEAEMSRRNNNNPLEPATLFVPTPTTVTSLKGEPITAVEMGEDALRGVFERPPVKVDENEMFAAMMKNKKQQVLDDCQEPPKDYILLSCVVMWCCCSPLAVLAFIFSLYVNSSFERRDYKTARRFSKASFWTSMFAIFVSCALVVIVLAIFWPENHRAALQENHQ